MFTEPISNRHCNTFPAYDYEQIFWFNHRSGTDLTRSLQTVKQVVEKIYL